MQGSTPVRFLHLSVTASIMSENTDTKLNPADEQATVGELKPAQHETSLATNPVGDEKLEAPKEATTLDTAKETAGSVATQATEAATAVAGAASTAATNLSSNVFGMFGGGPKKEKKDEDDAGADEPSGSSKAKKDDDDEVGCPRRRFEVAANKVRTPRRRSTLSSNLSST